MKRLIIFLISFLIVNYSVAAANLSVSEIKSGQTDSIRVFSTPDLFNISATWATEYNKSNPETKINVISVSDAELVKDLTSKGQIGFISGAISSGLSEESISKLIVGRDVIVPVINSKNPYMEEIIQKGISPENLLLYINSKDSKKWGAILGGAQSSKANLYYVDDETVSKNIKEFLGSNSLEINGIKKESNSELLLEIQKDPLGIGFCKIVDVIDYQKQELIENISLLPIDRNGNGTMDYSEKIYDDFISFSRGVWIGKYPKELFSNIYLVTSKQPKSEAETAFLKWVVNEGQKYLYSNGYSDLLISERTSATDKLYESQIYAGAEAENKSVFGKLFLFILGLVLAGFIFDIVYRYFKRENISSTMGSSMPEQVLDTNLLKVPGGLFFDKTHTWAFMEQNGFVKVGIDDFLQHVTGTITRIKMKSEGDKVKKGDQILSIIQNGKQLNLYAPISGIIREKNSFLDKNASIINSSPYNEGWVYRMEPLNWHRENQLLFMADRQREFIKKELIRLKDFLAAALGPDMKMYPQIILQDGGELVDNTLSNLGPEVWDDFQSKFIDPSRQVWFHEII